MILLDTNVIIDAQNEGSPFYTWSNLIAEGISTDGVAINAITLAELCSAARADSEKVQDELHCRHRHYRFPAPQQRFVAAHTGGIGLLAGDQAGAKLPACRCLISLLVRTRS